MSGTGFEIDNQYDLSVTNTGQFNRVTGVEELEKDLAVQIRRAVDEYFGTPSTLLKTHEVKSSIQSALEQDDRIVSVRNISFEFRDDVLVISYELLTVTGAISRTIQLRQ